MTGKETLDVFNIKERKGKDNFFRHTGVAWVNKDNTSANVHLYGDASDRKFHIRRRKPVGVESKDHQWIFEGVSLKSKLDVIAFIDTTKNKKVIRIGQASVNLDGSISGFYDILPRNMDFQVRLPKKEKAAETEFEIEF